MRHLAIRPRRHNLVGDIDSLFNSFFDAPIFSNENDCCFSPSVDVRETTNDVYLTFELPGLEKDEIKVGVENQILTVSGERKSRSEEKDDNYIRSEIRHGSFSRSFTLPKTVDLGKISADYKNGLLEIRLGKAEESKPKEIEVKVS